MTTMTSHRLVLAAAIVGLYGGLATAGPLPGAIFTTDADGVIVNGNTKYESKCGLTGVWLDGGPPVNAPSTAAGLPDGEYFFQVTDPSGSKLLSTDPVNERCVIIESGIITGNCLSGTHNLRPSADAGGGVVVELCPYDDTPNNGGVYKAWMTPTGDFAGDSAEVDNRCGNGCFHGFVPASSKTDNFKVRDVRTFCINVHKDILDDKGGVSPGVDWLISIQESLGDTAELLTDKDGNAERCGLTAGFYTVSETLQGGTTVYATEVDGVQQAPSTTVNVQLKNGLKDDSVSVKFTNTPKEEPPCEKDCPK